MLHLLRILEESKINARFEKWEQLFCCKYHEYRSVPKRSKDSFFLFWGNVTSRAMIRTLVLIKSISNQTSCGKFKPIKVTNKKKFSNPNHNLNQCHKNAEQKHLCIKYVPPKKSIPKKSIRKPNDSIFQLLEYLVIRCNFYCIVCSVSNSPISTIENCRQKTAFWPFLSLPLLHSRSTG